MSVVSPAKPSVNKPRPGSLSRDMSPLQKEFKVMQANYCCTQCGAHYEITPRLMLCPVCSEDQPEDQPLRGVLKVHYEPAALRDLASSPDCLADIHAWLPVPKGCFSPIPVGNTPLWQPPRLQQTLGFNQLFIKDEGTNPTYSFKDRASALVSAFARQHGIDEIVLASTGNAGSSMAGIGASQGQQVTLFLPHTAPAGKMIQAQQYGARLILVKGNYDKACTLAREYSQRFGGMNRNTAYNPMTLEGKKTAAIEIVRQLGHAPDHLFVAVGDGCILGGIYKGFTDLLSAGVIARMPKIWAVQAEHSAAIHAAFHHPQGLFESTSAHTLADSICVDVPANGFDVVEQLKRWQGETIKVSDEAILTAQKELSEKTGLFTEPAGATAFAGLLAARTALGRNEHIVIMATGNGLKDTATAARGNPPLPDPISSLDELNSHKH